MYLFRSFPLTGQMPKNSTIRRYKTNKKHTTREQTFSFFYSCIQFVQKTYVLIKPETMFRNYLVFRRAAAAAAAVVIFYCYYVYSLCVFFFFGCVYVVCCFFFTLFLACKHRHTCQMYIGSCCEAAAKFDGEEKTHVKCTPWRVKIERNNAIEHHKEKIKKLNKKLNGNEKNFKLTFTTVLQLMWLLCIQIDENVNIFRRFGLVRFMRSRAFSVFFYSCSSASISLFILIAFLNYNDSQFFVLACLFWSF